MKQNCMCTTIPILSHHLLSAIEMNQERHLIDVISGTFDRHDFRDTILHARKTYISQ